MVKIAFLVVIILFGNNTIFSKAVLASQASMLKDVIPSIVAIYSVNYKNNDLAKIFLESNSTEGDKGSGVIIRNDGLIITNYHVIKGNRYIKVILDDERVYQATLLHYDSNIDLAILKIDIKEDSVRAVKIISSQNIEVGEDVFAIGNPFGIGISVSAGIISALPNKDNIGLGNLIQTDTLLNPGNSGGALINSNGNLIGINTYIFTQEGNFSGIGFAIPSDLVSLFIDRALSGKKTKQYWLGFSAINVTNEIAKKTGLENPRGIIVTEIYDNSPAQRSQLHTGDIILQFGESQTNSMEALSFMVASIDVPTEKELSVFRAGKILKINIIPSLPIENSEKDSYLVEQGIFNGVTFVNNSQAIANEVYSSPNDVGIIVYDINLHAITDDNFIGNILLKGDMLVSINGAQIADLVDFKQAIINQRKKTSYRLLIKRKGEMIEFNVNHSN